MHPQTDHTRKTAAEYRQTADEHVRTLKDFWKDFLVSGLFVLAALVIIIACLAWFFANNQVKATSSSISAMGARFTITAAGEGQGSETGYYERNNRSELTSLDLEDSMVVTLTSNLNNVMAGSVYPGARGQITFTVTPIAKDLAGVTVNLSHILKTRNPLDTSRDADLLNFIHSHFLFFQSRDENGYYSDRVTGDAISIPKGRFCADGSTETTEPVTITLYWVWPEFLQNYVLRGPANYYRNLFSADSTADEAYKALQTDINTKKTDFYYGTVGKGETTTAAADAPNLSPTMTSTDLATCAALYNNADELIGDNLDYLQLRISAKEDAQ